MPLRWLQHVTELSADKSELGVEPTCTNKIKQVTNVAKSPPAHHIRYHPPPTKKGAFDLLVVV